MSVFGTQINSSEVKIIDATILYQPHSSNDSTNPVSIQLDYPGEFAQVTFPAGNLLIGYPRINGTDGSNVTVIIDFTFTACNGLVVNFTLPRIFSNVSSAPAQPSTTRHLLESSGAAEGECVYAIPILNSITSFCEGFENFLGGIFNSAVFGGQNIAEFANQFFEPYGESLAEFATEFENDAAEEAATSAAVLAIAGFFGADVEAGYASVISNYEAALGFAASQARAAVIISGIARVLGAAAIGVTAVELFCAIQDLGPKPQCAAAEGTCTPVCESGESQPLYTDQNACIDRCLQIYPFACCPGGLANFFCTATGLEACILSCSGCIGN